MENLQISWREMSSNNHNPALKFREAELGDLDQLYALEQEVVEAERPFNSSIKTGHPTYYDIEALLSGIDACLLVAENGGKIAATGYAQIRSSKASLDHDYHAYLGFMYVSPMLRGQGVNQRIIGMLTAWSQTQGVNDCYLDVYSGNASAIKAYEKIGFEASIIEMKLCMPK
jgi:ribosomal protein S18 acetylase RimI-like enzyme